MRDFGVSSLMKWTEPSHISRLAPPGWSEKIRSLYQASGGSVRLMPSSTCVTLLPEAHAPCTESSLPSLYPAPRPVHSVTHIVFDRPSVIEATVIGGGSTSSSSIGNPLVPM